ncbi:MAG: hypothetical protein K6C97_03960 [Treponema sp.]|nr:hypothetical protein [Treponema sp.]
MKKVCDRSNQNLHEKMHLLKTIKDEDIQVYCDDKNNIHTILFFDTDTNMEYMLDDILHASIQVKEISFDNQTPRKRVRILSSNGNEFIIPLYSLDFEMKAFAVQTSLKNLIEEFITVSSDIKCIGEEFVFDVEKNVLKILNESKENSFYSIVEGADGKFSFKTPHSDQPKYASTFEAAAISLLNEWRDYSCYCIRMGQMHGDRPPKEYTRK